MNIKPNKIVTLSPETTNKGRTRMLAIIFLLLAISLSILTSSNPVYAEQGEMTAVSSQTEVNEARTLDVADLSLIHI